jgi:hypothetical protein
MKKSRRIARVNKRDLAQLKKGSFFGVADTQTHSFALLALVFRGKTDDAFVFLVVAVAGAVGFFAVHAHQYNKKHRLV